MRALFVPVMILFILAGSALTYAERTAPINLKQLVSNQIARIRAREIKEETAAVDKKTPAASAAAADTVKKPGMESSLNDNAALNGDKTVSEKASGESKATLREKESLNNKASRTDDGLFLKAFILIDLSLLAALFVYWRRRKLKIGIAEKAKFKKNIIKLRSEGKFHRKAKSQSDELRKRLQLDPVCEVEDEALLRKHARKLSVPSGELMLASRIRSLEKAHE